MSSTILQHLLVAGSIDASMLPFALLDIVSMAETLSVCVVVARFNCAGLCGRCAVAVHGVAMPQEALVVHLAQAFGLDRLSAIILGAFRKLDPLP